MMDLQLAGRRALSPAATTGGISKAGDGAANAGTWGPPGFPSVRMATRARVSGTAVSEPT